MRTLDSDFQTHLEQEVTTLATCYLVTRLDGVKKGFTTYDQEITIDSVDYQPLSVSVTTDIDQMSSMAPANFELSAVIDSGTLTEDDLLNGVYDGAKVERFVINYNDLPTALTDTNLLMEATALIGEITLTDGEIFAAPLKGMKEKLNIKGTEVYSKNCRVKRLGDDRCKVSLTSHTHSLTVGTITNNYTFTHSGSAQADDYFKNGTLEWTSGDNDGTESQIKTYVDGVIELIEAPRYALEAGDGFSAIRGCDRLFATCRDVFNNVDNFRGEPHIPGLDELHKKRT